VLSSCVYRSTTMACMSIMSNADFPILNSGICFTSLCTGHNGSRVSFLALLQTQADGEID
jgi:hypothetical protein